MTRSPARDVVLNDHQVRSILKTMTWRLIGTWDDGGVDVCVYGRWRWGDCAGGGCLGAAAASAGRIAGDRTAEACGQADH